MIKSRGFTLVELVVVILVVAILVAVVTPKLLGRSKAATDNGLRQTLSTIRDAIEIYALNNDGDLPGASDGTDNTFKSDLEPYLRGSFPAAPVGSARGSDRIKMKRAGAPLSGNKNPITAWKYDYTTGEFILDYNGISNDGVTRYEDF